MRANVQVDNDVGLGLGRGVEELVGGGAKLRRHERAGADDAKRRLGHCAGDVFFAERHVGGLVAIEQEGRLALVGAGYEGEAGAPRQREQVLGIDALAGEQLP